MREMRGEVGMKTSKKEMENHSFLLRHMNQTWCKCGTDWAASIKIPRVLSQRGFKTSGTSVI